ncbi:hypothetical protein N7451_010916 [Penicillium sp. IBT 35674x]|nr:hypothetical protein N7451_010916 [Penicillium sp. IBT 35674x]
MYPLANEQAELLLPGFQGRNLQAGILNRNGEESTYVVTCDNEAGKHCGIPGNGLTVVKAESFAALTNTDSYGR